MKKIFVLLYILICVASVASANDCVFFVRGNQLIPDDTENDISVQKEILTISLQDDGFTSVNVYYEFFNKLDNDKKVVMGFEANPPYNTDIQFNPKGIHPYIKSFSVKVNDQNVSYKNAVVPLNTPQGFKPFDLNEWKAAGEAFEESNGQMLVNGNLIESYAYAYYFDATFKPGVNKIVHTYSYDTSFGVGQAFIVDYKLSPAVRWANKQIDDFTLVVRADKTAKHFMIRKSVFPNAEIKLLEGAGKNRVSMYYDTPYYEFTLRNGAFSLHETNYKPTSEDELCISSCENLYYTVDDKGEHMEIGCTYDRSRYFTYIIPVVKTDFDVKVAHNLPYAHRGHVFKNKELKEYFDKQWWYMPDSAYIDSQSDFTEKDIEFTKKEKDKLE